MKIQVIAFWILTLCSDMVGWVFWRNVLPPFSGELRVT